jgi:hypothetical protein
MISFLNEEPSVICNRTSSNRLWNGCFTYFQI